MTVAVKKKKKKEPVDIVAKILRYIKTQEIRIMQFFTRKKCETHITEEVVRVCSVWSNILLIKIWSAH